MIDLSISFKHRDRVAHHEAEARREMDAAVTLGEVGAHYPGFREEDYDWYVQVFSASRIELEEMRSAAAERYRSLPRRKRAARREAFEAYLSSDARLNAAMGLQSRWY